MLNLRALHFSHSESSNRLNKIENIVNYFNKKMKEVYEQSKNLALDESIVLFRGRLVFRQYIEAEFPCGYYKEIDNTAPALNVLKEDKIVN